MARRHLHFLYVPSDDRGIRDLRIPVWAVRAVVGTALVLFGALAFLGTAFVKHSFDSSQMATLEAQNRALHLQMDQMDRMVARLELQMQQGFDFQRKARHLAQIDDLDPGVLDVGVGGTMAQPPELPAGLEDHEFNRVQNIKGELDRLNRQARLLSETYGDIIEVLQSDSDKRARTPSIYPVRTGFISSKYGRRMDPFTGRVANHHGVDFSARRGSPILATADGVVVAARRNGSFGMLVEIDHGNGFVTRYAHAKELFVKRGQKIKRGHVIAAVGVTGRSTAPHLHYEIRHEGKSVNPLEYMLPDDFIYN